MHDFRQLLSTSPQLGFALTYPAAGIIEGVGKDWDWIWIDGQHGQMGYRDLLDAVRAAAGIGKPALVRVNGHDPGQIGLVLDLAPDAIMVPTVDSAEQASRIVQAAKFPPLGNRSYGGRRPIDLFGTAYCQTRQPLLVCQIETPDGLENCESIAAVEGVDALFFGADDMAVRHGLPMDRPRPTGYFESAQQRVAQAALRHGKIAGGVFPTADGVRKAVAWGYRLIACAADISFLLEGSSTRSGQLRRPQRRQRAII